MITGETITDEMIQRLIRETPAHHRTMETAMMFLAAQGKSPGAEFRLPTPEEKARARQQCADMINAREALRGMWKGKLS